LRRQSFLKVGMETGKKGRAVARESFKREKEKGLRAQQIGPTNIARETLNYQEFLRYILPGKLTFNFTKRPKFRD